MSDEETVALVGAALARFDSEGAFGAADPRTLAAKDRLRHRVGRCVRQDEAVESDRASLTVIHGGAWR